MYSILVLGLMMIAHGFAIRVPDRLSPAATFVIVGYFLIELFLSLRKHGAQRHYKVLNASWYRIVPEAPRSAPGSSSRAMNTSSGTSYSLLTPKRVEGRKPKRG
jgi:hypothetical protein